MCKRTCGNFGVFRTRPVAEDDPDEHRIRRQSQRGALSDASALDREQVGEALGQLVAATLRKNSHSVTSNAFPQSHSVPGCKSHSASMPMAKAPPSRLPPPLNWQRLSTFPPICVVRSQQPELLDAG